MKLSFFSQRPSTVIGIEIVDDFVRMAEISKTDNVYFLENFALAPLPSGAVVEGAVANKKILSDSVKDLLKKNKIKKHPAVLCLPASRVFIKYISLPVSTRDKIKKIILDDFHMYFHFPNPGEVYFDFAVVEQDKDNNTKVLVVVGRREIVANYLSALKDAGLNITTVGVDYFALQNLFELSHGISNSTTAIVGVGRLGATINIVKDGQTILVHDISLQEDNGTYFLGLPEELEQIFTYYNSTREDDFVENIFVTGEMCSAELVDLIAKNTGLPVEELSVFSDRLELSEQAQLQKGIYVTMAAKLAISIGAVIGNI